MTPREGALIALLCLTVAAGGSPLAATHADDCGPGIITTVAGGRAGDGGPAVEASLRFPHDVAVDTDGSLYIADTENHRIRKVDPAGIITTVAGSGVRGHSGDGGPATAATLCEPQGIAIGPDGSVYIADTADNRIRKIDPAGIITTVAGDGDAAYSGDGGPAVHASLYTPADVAVDVDGALYIADCMNHRIRRVDPAGTITTIAGTGESGSSGDGGPAIQASLRSPRGVAVGPDGALYIADLGNHRVRKVDAAGIITNVAGVTPTSGWESDFAGDGGPATLAHLNYPVGLALAADGTLYIGDRSNQRVRKVDPGGIITTVAGIQGGGYSGDGGPASATRLSEPCGVAVGPDGALYIADRMNYRIRDVDSAGIIHTVAGNGQPGYAGDGGAAADAAFVLPSDVAAAPDGSILVADTVNSLIRKIDPGGIITTVAGGGNTYPGDGGPATAATLFHPSSVAVGPEGSLYLTDTEYHRVCRVDPDGVLTTVAGVGLVDAYSDEVGPATQLPLSHPVGVAVGADGTIYISKPWYNRIRKVDPAGIISTFAGNGQSGYSGDGGPASQARLYMPSGLAMGPDGSLYIADSLNHRIRRIDSAGIITTVAGNGIDGYSGDGGLATEASLRYPFDVAVDRDGTVYIADTYNNRIRRVDPNGIITTVAANDGNGYSGDGAPALSGGLDMPLGVAVGRDGELYIADTWNNWIRKVTPGPCCAPGYQPAVGVAGQAVTFDANASVGGGMTVCQWDFGDGAHASGCEPTHVYSSPGEYLACVTVTNGEGVSHTCCTTVAVTCECDVALVPSWCRMLPGKVDQRRPGHIAARNSGSQPCEVMLRVRNGAGSVVFETTRTLAPFGWTRVRFVHTFTPADAGWNRWAWEVWPVECDERTPGDNVFERPVRVIAPR